MNIIGIILWVPYFMVFGANALPGKGSYTLDEIVGVLKEL
jgi:hypothetical protein